MPTKRKSAVPNCILCRRGADEAGDRCTFHTGGIVDHSDLISMAITAWGVAGNVDPEVVKVMQDHRHTRACCEKFRMYFSEEDESTFAKGCWEAKSHLFSARCLCIADTGSLALAREAVEAIPDDVGIDFEVIEIDEYDGSPDPEINAMAIITGASSRERSVALADAVAAKRPDIGLTIFSDPNAMDDWRLQAASSEGLSGETIRSLIVSSLRHSLGTPMTEPKPIFLSYTRADLQVARYWAQDIARHFEPCWADWEMLSPGIEWSNAIESGIRTSRDFCLLLTDKTPERTYCWKELCLAREFGAKITIIANGLNAAEKLIKAELAGFGKWRPVYLELEPEEQTLALVEEANDNPAVCIILSPTTQQEANSWDEGQDKRFLAIRFIKSGFAESDIDTDTTEKYLEGRDWKSAELKLQRSNFERMPPERQKEIQRENLARNYADIRRRKGWMAEMHMRLDNYYLCRDNPKYHSSQVESRDDIFRNIRRRYGLLAVLTIRITDFFRRKRNTD